VVGRVRRRTLLELRRSRARPGRWRAVRDEDRFGHAESAAIDEGYFTRSLLRSGGID
jgi:hypothetical protein